MSTLARRQIPSRRRLWLQRHGAMGLVPHHGFRCKTPVIRIVFAMVEYIHLFDDPFWLMAHCGKSRW